jgi:hypothetical protein
MCLRIFLLEITFSNNFVSEPLLEEYLTTILKLLLKVNFFLTFFNEE